MRQVSENDPRLHHLEEVDILEDEDWEDDAWEDEEAWIDEEDLKARTVEQQQKTGPLSVYLEKYSKAQLVELIDELAHVFPDAREFLEDRRNVRSGNVRNMIKAVRQEIADIGQPDRDDYGHGYQSANFGRLQEYLQALLQTGQADEIVHLGKELIGAAKFAVETYDHDGEVLYEIVSALEKAGRVDKIIPLCEQEADITGNYTRLVDLLIDEKRVEKQKQKQTALRGSAGWVVGQAHCRWVMDYE